MILLVLGNVPLALASSPSTTSSGASSSGVITSGPLPSGVFFTDINGNYAEYDIVELAQAGIIPVPSDLLFHPNQPITRLNFTDWVSRALELPPSTKPLSALFKDASSVPTADQGLIAAAVQAGLIQGEPGDVFDPSGVITRAQAATIFGRYLESKGQQPNTLYFQVFADGNTIPPWAAPASVLFANALVHGEVCGQPSVCFEPNQDTTRAQAATLIVRVLSYLTANYHQPPLSHPTSTTPFLMGMWDSTSQEAYANLTAYGATSINWLVVGGYDILPDGTLSGFDSEATLQWAATHPSVQTWVMVQALGAPYINFLSSASEQQAIVQSIITVVQRAGYAGVNFDIEDVPASEASAYLSFITNAASALHAIGAKISVDVVPETASSAGDSWAVAYNYPALGNIVDYICMMAYDYHYPGGNPGPISPISDDESAIQYAVSVIPAHKVILGVANYGYIWNTSNDSAIGYWESGMEHEAALHDALITNNSEYEESTFTYTSGGDTFVGWFVDATDIAYRLDLAKETGIGGVIAWRMDYGNDWWSVWAQDLAAWH